ncbi:CoA transferase subunit A [Halorussus halophilus]|uniref:CoA transferase subunit A n=1 Tax=Halorussus halophilus TaxID=2650975 RepID=UPI00130117E6|nr:CoA transferase subunit A [Halorussus halophilus]
MTEQTTLESAIDAAVEDGQSLYLAGFSHLIPFASGHEIIRQGYTDLELVRATPDLIYDRMIAAGCASKATFSWAGNPGVGCLRAFRRAVEEGVPNPLEIEEYTHFGMVARLKAGAQKLPFVPLRTFAGSDLPEYNDKIRTVADPFSDDGENEGEDVHVVPPLEPDTAVVRAQRADADGNAQLWGIVGETVDAALAAETVVLSVEQVVDESVIRSDPNRTMIPGTAVDYVVEIPYGSHPSYVQGYYDRDNPSYVEWDEVSETHESTLDWLDEWVYEVTDHREYLEKLDAERLLDLQPQPDYAEPIDMGDYS